MSILGLAQNRLVNKVCRSSTWLNGLVHIYVCVCVQKHINLYSKLKSIKIYIDLEMKMYQNLKSPSLDRMAWITLMKIQRPDGLMLFKYIYIFHVCNTPPFIKMRK
jgi:hypothetical protein